jgi:hypothetical protein
MRSITNLPLKYFINILLKKQTLRVGAKSSKTVTPSLNYFAVQSFYATYLDISLCQGSCEGTSRKKKRSHRQRQLDLDHSDWNITEVRQ